MLSGDVNVVRRCDTHHPAPAETALAPDRKHRDITLVVFVIVIRSECLSEIIKCFFGSESIRTHSHLSF